MKYLLFPIFAMFLILVGVIVVFSMVSKVTTVTSDRATTVINEHKPKQSKPIIKQENAIERNNTAFPICSALEELSTKIMTVRQQNIPQEKVTAFFLEPTQTLNSQKGSSASLDIASRFVLLINEQAYKTPLMETVYEKEKIIHEFSKKTYELCVEKGITE